MNPLGSRQDRRRWSASGAKRRDPGAGRLGGDRSLGSSGAARVGGGIWASASWGRSKLGEQRGGLSRRLDLEQRGGVRVSAAGSGSWSRDDGTRSSEQRSWGARSSNQGRRRSEHRGVGGSASQKGFRIGGEREPWLWYHVGIKTLIYSNGPKAKIYMLQV